MPSILNLKLKVSRLCAGNLLDSHTPFFLLFFVQGNRSLVAFGNLNDTESDEDLKGTFLRSLKLFSSV
jgi:hypothetical protein